MSNRIQFNSTSDLDALVAAFPNSFPPSSTVTPLPDYENFPQCRQTALFLHHMPTSVATFLPVVLGFLAILLTFTIRGVTPGAGLPEQQPPKVNDAENADVELESHTLLTPETQSIPVFVIDDVDDSDHPPPYQPPAPTPAHVVTPAPEVTLTSAPQTPLEKRSSAHLFVLGTTAVIPLFMTMFLLALCIQHEMNCTEEGIAKPRLVPQLLFWGFYTCLAAGVSVGVLSWLILLRNLWGPAAAKRYPINETIIGVGFAASCLLVVASPFLLLWYGGKLVGKINVAWAEKAVEMCQRRFCGDALEDIDREGAEFEEGVALVGREENGESSASQDEGAENSQRVDKPVMR